MVERRRGPVVAHPTGDVRVAVDDGIVTVTIDRPAKKNALTQEMYGRVPAQTGIAGPTVSKSRK